MSNEYSERFLEERYEHYIELGHGKEKARSLAYEDLEHDQYDYVPEEEDDE